MGDLHKTCPKCDSAMDRGFTPDVTHGAVMQSGWVAGEPHELRFLGMNAGLKVSLKDAIPITVYRCGKCGFLESYAATPG